MMAASDLHRRISVQLPDVETASQTRLWQNATARALALATRKAARETPARTGRLRQSFQTSVRVESIRSGYLEVRYDSRARYVPRAREILRSREVLRRMRVAINTGAQTLRR